MRPETFTLIKDPAISLGFHLSLFIIVLLAAGGETETRGETSTRDKDKVSNEGKGLYQTQFGRQQKLALTVEID